MKIHSKETYEIKSEQLTLLNNFSLETLFNTTDAASYDIKSNDIEMGSKKTEFSFNRNINHIPEDLRNIPEYEEIFNFIRTPTTNIIQLQQRQIFIESLLKIKELDVLVQLKTTSYKVNQGISTIFSLISIDEYQKETALYTYRNKKSKEAKAIVLNGISLVNKGKQAIKNLISLLSSSNNHFIKKITTEYKNLSKSLKDLNKDFFLKKDYNLVASTSKELSETSKKIITRSGVFFEFAKLAKKDNYGSAQFNPSQPRYYKQGWNFIRKKESQDEKQVLNDSPDDHKITIYSGSNMSGKSFSGLKKEFFIQCLAQSFGYGTWEGKANFPKLYNSFHYLDRTSTRHLDNLSAFGSEVNNWNHLTSNLSKNAFVCIDEGWSTTSAEDQYKLLHASAILYLSSKNAKFF